MDVAHHDVYACQPLRSQGDKSVSPDKDDSDRVEG